MLNDLSDNEKEQLRQDNNKRKSEERTNLDRDEKEQL